MSWAVACNVAPLKSERVPRDAGAASDAAAPAPGADAGRSMDAASAAGPDAASAADGATGDARSDGGSAEGADARAPIDTDAAVSDPDAQAPGPDAAVSTDAPESDAATCEGAEDAEPCPLGEDASSCEGPEDAEPCPLGEDAAAAPDAAPVDTGYVVEEHFVVPDGAPWPAPWTPAGGVDLSEVFGGEGRYRPLLSNYSLARLYYPGPMVVSCEATFTLGFDDLFQQGIGFYTRTRGGYLTQTSTPGLGYAVYIDGARGTPGIGIWRELGGVEMEIQTLFNPTAMMSGGRYRVRFRVEQAAPDRTHLSARIWPLGDPEPTQWHVELDDTEPSLQGRAGGFAFDGWSNFQAGGPVPAWVLVDDLQVVALP